MINVPVSIGEVFDKISILLIKKNKIPLHQNDIQKEIELLQAAVSNYELDNEIFNDLKNINEQLWEIEDKIREKERLNSFDQEFIELARSVYISNDRRAQIKKKINTHFGSVIKEFKSYKEYR